MSRFRRTPFCFFAIEEDELLDVRALLSGTYEVTRATRFFALSPLDGSKHAIESGDLDGLMQIPVDRWASVADLQQLGMELDWLDSMARRGLLLSDQDEPKLSELKRRAEILESEQWHPQAALYHFMIRASERRSSKALINYAAVEARSEERASRFVARHGVPPEPFKPVATSKRVDLPLVEKEGDLYESLRRRKTIRAFDPNACMKLDDAATLLRYVFGCHGYMYLSPEVLMLHRTSPSGGSRHPIEVYPLVLRVDGLATGLYHYDSRNHALELLRKYDLCEARTAAIEIAGGQQHAGAAHLLFIMTARFFRNHWKYRRKGRTYAVMLMDAAHLSQTLYLVATDLKLGAFFSAALDAPKADSLLEIDGYEEGAIAICGCGVTSAGMDHSLPFHPFTPRRTKL